MTASGHMAVKVLSRIPIITALKVVCELKQLLL